MGPIPWSSATRVAALLVTVFFVAASVLQVLIVFELLGPRPGGGVDFIDEVLSGFEWEQDRWPVEFAATLLFGAGFVALGGLGTLLAGLAARGDARRSLVSGAYLGAGGLGLASQLLWLGVKPTATSPDFCECGLRAEEVMSRLMILNVAGETQLWMAIGATLLAAIGAVLIAPVGRRAGMPWAGSGWRSPSPSSRCSPPSSTFFKRSRPTTSSFLSSPASPCRSGRCGSRSAPRRSPRRPDRQLAGMIDPAEAHPHGSRGDHRGPTEKAAPLSVWGPPASAEAARRDSLAPVRAMCRSRWPSPVRQSRCQGHPLILASRAPRR